MKKSLFLGMLFLSLIVFSEKASAQCPTGYTPMQVNVMVNGCMYEVDLCIRCSPLGYISESVLIRGFVQIPQEPECTQTLHINEVLQYLDAHLTNYDFFYTHICPNQYGTPPCPGQSQPIEISHWTCWRAKMIEYFGKVTIYYEPCNYDEYCWEKIAWCYNANNNKNVRIRVEGPTQYGTPSCTLEAWEITMPTEVGQVSECYIMHNICQ